MLENRTQLVGILYLFIYCCCCCFCCCGSNRKRVRRTWVANVYVLYVCVCDGTCVKSHGSWMSTLVWTSVREYACECECACIWGTGLKLSSAESIPAQRVSTCIRLIKFIAYLICKQSILWNSVLFNGKWQKTTYKLLSNCCHCWFWQVHFQENYSTFFWLSTWKYILIYVHWKN